MKKKIRFIVNPVSGASWKRGDIEALLQKHLDYEKYIPEICFTQAAGHAIELSKKAVDKNVDVIVAVGGDGSVNEVSSQLIHTESTLGVLPGGSGNGYAMHLGIGRRMKKAIEILNNGKVHVVDTIRLNGMPYVNLSGVGFAANIAYKFKQSKKRGFINYFAITMNQAYKFPFQKYEISVDDQPFIKRECLMVEVANSTSFGYNFKPAPMAKIDDGLMDLIIVNARPKWKYFLSFPKMINGRIHTSNYMENISCKKVKIKIPDNSYIHLDGEGQMISDELNYEIVPNSLKVIAP